MTLKPCEISERRKQTVSHNMSAMLDSNFLKRFSSMCTMKRVVAYCLRFIHNARPRNIVKFKGNLSLEEISQAEISIIKIVQTTAFPIEIGMLSKGKSIDGKSKFLSLSPFFKNGLVRVEGRLHHFHFTYNQNHSILIPNKSHITYLIIIREKHLELKHAGIQTTLYSIRDKFWVLGGRNTVRRIIRQCAICSRMKPSEFNYIMENLPASRLTYSRPFLNVGIDYCGPFFVKEKRHRNTKRIKSYDLTTDSHWKSEKTTRTTWQTLNYLLLQRYKFCRC